MRRAGQVHVLRRTCHRHSLVLNGNATVGIGLQSQHHQRRDVLTACFELFHLAIRGFFAGELHVPFREFGSNLLHALPDVGLEAPRLGHPMRGRPRCVDQHLLHKFLVHLARGVLFRTDAAAVAEQFGGFREVVTHGIFL